MSYSKILTSVFCSLLAACFLIPMIAQAQSDVAREKMLIKANNRPLVSLQDAVDRARALQVESGPAREVPNFRTKGKPAFDGGTAVSDAILQDVAGEQITAIGSGFPGSSNDDNAAIAGFMIAPPDTDGQIGPNHFVQMINLLTTIFDKQGNVLLDGPFTSNAFWLGEGGNCEAYNQGDPIVLYDDVEDRWLVSQFAFPDSMASYSQCVAISATGDPLGEWHRYEFSFLNYGLNDYPKHGIVSDSITMTANIFTPRGRSFRWGGTFLGVMDKAAMYAGAPTARMIGFNIGTAEFGFVAGDLDGGGTAPALFGTTMPTVNAFDIWQHDVDWTQDPAPATVSKVAIVPITPFDSELCTASRGACIPQPDGGPLLESLSDRLMHRLQIRDFSSYRTMVTAHTVDVDGVGDGRAGIRWYELRQNKVDNIWSDWLLYQEGTFGPADGKYRFMPSAAMNAAGDIGIGYLLSGTNTYVSTAVVGQTANASGSDFLDSEEVICAAGTGVQEDVARSGDYSSTSIDPVDDSFWHTNEVFTKTGSFQWDTFVCEFVVADSGSNTSPTASFTFDCTDLACTFDGSASTDSDGTISTYAWDFDDGGTASGPTPSYTYGADGTYSVTLTVTDNEGATGADTQSVSVSTPVSNTPPTAAFTFNCSGLDCAFTDESSDTGGSVVSWSWDFGDSSGTSTLQNPDYSFSADDTYPVTLIVTDNEGASDTVIENVMVAATTCEPDLVGSAEITSAARWMATVEDLGLCGLQGTWSASATALCTDSICTLSNIHKRILSVTFTADGSGEQITILKP